MVSLVLSVVVLAAGPLLAHATAGRRGPLAALDAFVLISVAGLILLHIVPEAVPLGGLWILGTAAVGLALPGLFERGLHVSHGNVHRAVLALAVCGLTIHAAADGLALAQQAIAHSDLPPVVRNHFHGQESLGIAVVLHRIPVGLLLWLALRARFGRLVAIGSLAALAAATVAGYQSGAAFGALEGAPRGHLLAFVGGSLLHVLTGHGAVGHSHDERGEDACDACPHDHAPADRSEELPPRPSWAWVAAGAVPAAALLAAVGTPVRGLLPRAALIGTVVLTVLWRLGLRRWIGR